MPLTMSMSVAQLLKKETFAAHTQAEKILAPKLASIQSFDDYASILKMFYGFFHPLETRIKQQIAQDILLDIDERRNALFILNDLIAIQHSTGHIALCKSRYSDACCDQGRVKCFHVYGYGFSYFALLQI